MAVLSIGGILAVLNLPRDWQIERRATIQASPEVVFGLLVDLDRWPEWSPWRESDYEDLEFVYEGPRQGVGAAYTWDSETTGDGRLEIVEVDAPERLVFTMAMQSGKVQTTETLTLASTPSGGVEVTWVDRGELLQTLLGRLSIPVIQESMGRDLDTGLQRLGEAVAAGQVAEVGKVGEAD